MKARGASSPWVISALALGLLVGVWAGVAVRRRPVDTAAEDMARVEERLAGIERALDEWRPSHPSTGGGLDAVRPIDPPASRKVVESDSPRPPSDAASFDQGQVDQVLAAVQRLEDSLRAEIEATRELVRSEAVREDVLVRIRDQRREIDWYAWQEVLDLWQQDPDAARRQVKLLTDEEVLDRFGPPTDIWSNTNGITWQYARDLDPTTGKYATDIILRMPAGFVTQLAVRR